MMQRKEYSPAALEERHETFTSLQPAETTRKKKNKIKNKKRFSDEQIRSLELIFESETKLEPRKKVQLARELNLQPRQVAIWFQNRRARWKSKQIEQEYRKLRDSYDNLASRFESLKKEKQSLIIQLQNLGDLLGKTHDGNSDNKVLEGNSTDGRSESDHENTNSETEAKPGCLQEQVEVMRSQEDNNEFGNLGKEGNELLNTSEHVEGPLVSIEKWYSHDLGGRFDEFCSSSYWLNFWS